MIKLVPMTETEFQHFMKISMKDQADGHVQTGRWKAEEAAENIRQLRAQFLPDDLKTPNHYFFTLKTEENENIGGLWYAVMEQDGQRQVFVVDVQIFPDFRRQGYATQAFLRMENQASQMGIKTITLHVFKHNYSARALYEKLGYEGENETMVKRIVQE